MFVRGPGVAQGVKLNDVVLNIDIAPTFIELMGQQVPEFMDGQSFAGLLSGQDAQASPFRKDFLVSYHGEYQEVGFLCC